MRKFRVQPRVAAIAALASCSAVIVGCGGDEPGVDNPTVLSGTAAVGAPLAGATITVSDADDATPDTAPVTTGADGRFSVDVSARSPALCRA